MSEMTSHFDIDGEDNRQKRQVEQANTMNTISPQVVAPATNNQKDTLSELTKLADLHKSGHLTDEEFKQQKSKILNS